MTLRSRTLKLGTRRSLLAWAQSLGIARQIEKLNPGVSVELVGIETRGDRIQDIPLGRVEGKEFFVAEIDEALRSGQVDLTVHSMKDLSLERPTEFFCAAIPCRENPRDCIVFGPSADKKISENKKLQIGTSSPRRLENIPAFIQNALPGADCEWLEIRGNVNTRLSRLHEAEASERHLDGVVLALAGLIRLWKDEAGRKELSKLFQSTRWMVLPLRECPSAPGQGALAIECRKNDETTRQLLAPLHDATSAEQVSRERAILQAWGGGCHQKFGATALNIKDAGDLLYIRGRKPDGNSVDEVRWQPTAGTMEEPRGAVHAWNGAAWRAKTKEEIEDFPAPPNFDGKFIFVSHWRAIPETWISALRRARGARVWTSGVTSWFKLAAQGIWVEGCGENLGFEFLRPTLADNVLGIPARNHWLVLTHQSAQADWEGLNVIATYRVPGEYPDAAIEDLRQATHVYWSSGSQFKGLAPYAPKEANHACGPGKTSQVLKEQGIRPLIFPSVEEWKKWIKI